MCTWPKLASALCHASATQTPRSQALQLHVAHAAAEAQARPWLLESRSSATGWQQGSASGGNRFIQARSRARRSREAQGSIASTSSSSPSDHSNHMANNPAKRGAGPGPRPKPTDAYMYVVGSSNNPSSVDSQLPNGHKGYQGALSGHELNRYVAAVLVVFPNMSIAGGTAGMMEALVCHPLGTTCFLSVRRIH